MAFCRNNGYEVECITGADYFGTATDSVSTFSISARSLRRDNLEGLMPRVCLLFIMVLFLSILIVKPSMAAKQKNQEGANSFDFGMVSGDAENRRTFSIPNGRGETLRILKAESPCDGLQIVSYPQEIAPRQKGELTVRWLPCQPGEKICKILLETDNPANRSLSFEVKAFIRSGTTSVEIAPTLTKIPAEWITRKVRKRDPSLVVSMESVQKELKARPETVLVDVRPKSEFEKVRIPGSINVDLSAVKSKAFLKGKPVVLISEGYHYGPLEGETRVLRDSGFTASILDGGLAGWRQKKGPLEGDAFAQMDLNRVPPQIFSQERSYDHWVVVDASKADKRVATYLLPESVPLDLANDPGKIAEQVKTVVAKQKNAPFLSILVFDDGGNDYERMERALSNAGITNLFFLQGGIAGYRAFLEQQASILQPSQQPKKTVNRCGSCP
jgi:rhodanese-related sulfurtransferase